MDIKLNCIHCGQSIAAPRDLFGTRVQCPSCGGEFMVTSSLVGKSLIASSLASLVPAWRKIETFWRERLSGKQRKIAIISVSAFFLIYWLSRPSSENKAARNMATGNYGLHADSGMTTDDELPDNGSKTAVVMMRMLGVTEGAKFAQTYGRRPTKAEFISCLYQKTQITPELIEQGTPKVVRMNRRMVYEFNLGFEQGCKSALEQNGPAF